jgi:hypothetical protein
MRSPSQCASWTSTRTTPEVSSLGSLKVWTMRSGGSLSLMPRSRVAFLSLGREAMRGGASAGRPAQRAGCPAVLGLQAPTPNSLRALRPLRSDSGVESALDARCARGPEALCASATLRRAAAHHLPPWASDIGAPSFGACPHPLSRWLDRRRGAPVERRGAQGSGPARASALRPHARRRCLSAAPGGRGASSAAGARTRAPQGSRPYRPAAPPKRRGACQATARPKDHHPQQAGNKT